MELDKERDYQRDDIAWQVTIYRQEHNGYIVTYNHHGNEINDPRKDYTGIVLPNTGDRFKTPNTAKTAMEAKGLTKTHEIVRYNGGYALCPKQK